MSSLKPKFGQLFCPNLRRPQSGRATKKRSIVLRPLNVFHSLVVHQHYFQIRDDISDIVLSTVPVVSIFDEVFLPVVYVYLLLEHCQDKSS